MSRPFIIYVLIVLALAAILAFTPACAIKPSVNQTYPPMPEGALPGDITGKLSTYNVNQGIADAYVAIVNASNVSVAYAISTTDQAGNYSFSNVNSTDGQPRYRIFTMKDGIGEGYSNMFEVTPSGTIFVPTIMIVPDAPAPSPTPSPTPAPYPVSSGTGYVSGRIKTGNGQGMYGATITVVNAGNDAFTYGSTMTDSNGFYGMETNGVSTEQVFQVLVHKDGYQDMYSVTFSLLPYGSAMINITDNSFVPSPTSTPSPAPSPSPAATPTIAPTGGPATPSPQQPVATTTITPVPAASSTPRPAPGFAAVIAIISLAGAVVYKKLR
jgi:hypothetical protein